MKTKKSFFKSWIGKILTLILAVVVLGFLFMQFLYGPIFEWYTGVKNAELTFDTSKEVTEVEFEEIAKELTYKARYQKAKMITLNQQNEFTRENKINMLINTQSFMRNTDFKHIKFFRDAGIRQYKGPETCLQCHETMRVKHQDNTVEEVNTMEDVVNSIHFTFQSNVAGFTTFGFDGRKVNEEGRTIPVGKIDRACGIPGSFSWTGWAEIIKTYPNGKDGEIVYRSEGCGQCHIGGNYHPATEKMMPIGDVPESTRQGIDCLICHSQTYDMNYKYVIKDENGYRWNQDRTLKAAMSVTLPSNDNCLTCHQHDLGGDVYERNKVKETLGYKNQRILHEGTKRGTPFAVGDDVHATAGLICTDCHVPEGHKIPRGIKGSDLVSNDLPGKKVDCENCHTAAPHTENKLTRVILNGHTDRLACETCHIKELEPENVVLRDWVNATWNEEEGIFTPTDLLHSGEVGVGFDFFWYNGNGTFLAGALGSNPTNIDETEELYNVYMDQYISIDNPEAVELIRNNYKKYFADKNISEEEYLRPVFQPASQLTQELMKKREKMSNNNLIPLQKEGVSKIYPFKIFNAMMYEDMSNSGPFGAMILPFDYPTYYETGNTTASMKKAIENPIVERMYQLLFKEYMMDEFMKYFGVEEWSAEYPINDKGELRNIESKWMRQNATLMVNHGIERNGRQCSECHSTNGIMNFDKLGYSKTRAEELRNLPEIKYFEYE